MNQAKKLKQENLQWEAQEAYSSRNFHITHSHGGTENAGVENAEVEISARNSKKRQGVENAGVKISPVRGLTVDF